MDGPGFSFSYLIFLFAGLETEPDGTGERVLEISFRFQDWRFGPSFLYRRGLGKNHHTLRDARIGWTDGAWVFGSAPEGMIGEDHDMVFPRMV